MLDEQEFHQVMRLLDDGQSCLSSGWAAIFGPALKEYERITGFVETNPNALHHHRISLYGPECRGCGRPLRTPKATRCASCGMLLSN